MAEVKEVNNEKLKALQLTLDKLEKTYGKGTVMKLGDSQVEDVEAISSGSLGLDLALGVGGYPRGRIIEIYGPESSGKTTLTIHAIAEAQKAGGIGGLLEYLTKERDCGDGNIGRQSFVTECSDNARYHKYRESADNSMFWHQQDIIKKRQR